MSGIVQPEWSPTVAEFEGFLDESDLLPKQGRIMRSLLDEYRESVMQPAREGYQADAERHASEHEAIADEIGLLTEAARRITEGLETGRIEAKAGRRDLTRIFADIKRARARSERLREAEEAAWARLNRTPAEIQSEQLRRFPVMKTRLPALNEDVVTGRAQSPYRRSSSDR